MTRIYLVEDHPIVREGLRSLLAQAGHEVVGEAGELTVALAEILRLLPDIVLLDLQLGALSGLPLLDDLRKRGVDTRVIIITSSEHTRDVAQAVRAGARGYVRKSALAEDLLQAVSDVAAGRRHFGAGLAEVAVHGLTEAPAAPDQLSARELQIVVLVARGASSAEIGAQLHLSPKTVDTYRSRAMAKIGVANMPALVRWTIREGLIALDE
jgi:two-component system, NarL family, invasion response regulator UvrY